MVLMGFICGNCGKKFMKQSYRRPTPLFCSKECSAQSRIGKFEHSEETKSKISKSLIGKSIPIEVKKKISKTMKEICKSDSEREKRRKSSIGREVSMETRKKISKSLMGHEGAYKGKRRKYETKVKISASHQGIEMDDWERFVSFEPYCYKFNNELKENVRNGHERKCVLCGKSEILNGRRLDIHHIDGDKMQGCEGKKFHLIPLCRSCHASKDTALKEFQIAVRRWTD